MLKYSCIDSRLSRFFSWKQQIRVRGKFTNVREKTESDFMLFFFWSSRVESDLKVQLLIPSFISQLKPTLGLFVPLHLPLNRCMLDLMKAFMELMVSAAASPQLLRACTLLPAPSLFSGWKAAAEALKSVWSQTEEVSKSGVNCSESLWSSSRSDKVLQGTCRS